MRPGRGQAVLLTLWGLALGALTGCPERSPAPARVADAGARDLAPRDVERDGARADVSVTRALDAAPPAPPGPRYWARDLPDGGSRFNELAARTDVSVDGGQAQLAAVVADDGRSRYLVAAQVSQTEAVMLGRTRLPRTGRQVELTLARPLPHLDPVVRYVSQRRHAEVTDSAEVWARIRKGKLEVIARREESKITTPAGRAELPPDEALRASEERARRVKAARTAAIAHEARGRTPEALAAWRELLDADGADAAARAHLGRGLEKLGRTEEAQRELELALELGDRSPATLKSLCAVYRARRSPHAEATCAGGDGGPDVSPVDAAAARKRRR